MIDIKGGGEIDLWRWSVREVLHSLVKLKSVKTTLNKYLGNRISLQWAIVLDPNEAIDIGEWSTCGGGRLERFYCV